MLVQSELNDDDTPEGPEPVRDHIRASFTFGPWHRLFFAAWTGEEWACRLSGYNMRTLRWLSPSQTHALSTLRTHANTAWALGRWKMALVDLSPNWDGIQDQGWPSVLSEIQLELHLQVAA